MVIDEGSADYITMAINYLEMATDLQSKASSQTKTEIKGIIKQLKIILSREVY